MQVMGKIIELFPGMGGVYPPSAYHIAFSSCLLRTAITPFTVFQRTPSHTLPQNGVGESRSRWVIAIIWASKGDISERCTRLKRLDKAPLM